MTNAQRVAREINRIAIVPTSVCRYCYFLYPEEKPRRQQWFPLFPSFLSKTCRNLSCRIQSTDINSYRNANRNCRSGESFNIIANCMSFGKRCARCVPRLQDTDDPQRRNSCARKHSGQSNSIVRRLCVHSIRKKEGLNIDSEKNREKRGYLCAWPRDHAHKSRSLKRVL